MTSVPLLVATDEAARKLMVPPPSVAAVAERNVGIAGWAYAAGGASHVLARSATETRAADLRLDDRRPTLAPVRRAASSSLASLLSDRGTVADAETY